MDPPAATNEEERAEQQAEEMMLKVCALPSHLQKIATGIVLGLQQITEEQKEEAALFIEKVGVHAKNYPEIIEFLESMTKCYLSAWEYELVMRCLNEINK